MKTIIRKNIRDGWEALTDHELGQTPAGMRLLRIHTSKVYGGDLTTSATVFHRRENSMVHAFGTAASGDYRKQLERSKVRCTDKAVTAQHERWSEILPKLIEEATAFYLNKERVAA